MTAPQERIWTKPMIVKFLSVFLVSVVILILCLVLPGLNSDEEVVPESESDMALTNSYINWINYNLRGRFPNISNIHDLKTGEHLMGFMNSIYYKDSFYSTEPKVFRNPKTNFQHVHLLLKIQNRTKNVDEHELIEGKLSMILIVLKNILDDQVAELWKGYDEEDVLEGYRLYTKNGRIRSFSPEYFSDGILFCAVMLVRSISKSGQFPYNTHAFTKFTTEERLKAVFEYGARMDIPPVLNMEGELMKRRNQMRIYKYLIQHNVNEEFIKLYLGFMFKASYTIRSSVEHNYMQNVVTISKLPQIPIEFLLHEESRPWLKSLHDVTKTDKQSITDLRENTGHDTRQEYLQKYAIEKLTQILQLVISENNNISKKLKDLRMRYERINDYVNTMNCMLYIINLDSLRIEVENYLSKMQEFIGSNHNIIKNVISVLTEISKARLGLFNFFEETIYKFQQRANEYYNYALTDLTKEMAHYESLGMIMGNNFTLSKYVYSLSRSLGTTKELINFSQNNFPYVASVYPHKIENANITNEIERLRKNCTITFTNCVTLVKDSLPKIIVRYQLLLGTVDKKICNVTKISSRNNSVYRSHAMIDHLNKCNDQIVKLNVKDTIFNIKGTLSTMPNENFFKKLYADVNRLKQIYEDVHRNFGRKLDDTLLQMSRDYQARTDTLLNIEAELKSMEDIGIHRFNDHEKMLRHFKSIQMQLYDPKNREILRNLDLYVDLSDAAFGQGAENKLVGSNNFRQLLANVTNQEVFNTYYQQLYRFYEWGGAIKAIQFQEQLKSLMVIRRSARNVNPSNSSELIEAESKLKSVLQKCNHLIIELNTEILQSIHPETYLMLMHYVEKIKKDTLTEKQSLIIHLNNVIDLDHNLHTMEEGLNDLICPKMSVNGTSIKQKFRDDYSKIYESTSNMYRTVERACSAKKYTMLAKFQEIWDAITRRANYASNIAAIAHEHFPVVFSNC